MNDYIYKCSGCRLTFDKETIESGFVYLCPACGNVGKNMPLRGVLLLEYDYAGIKRRIDKKSFLRLPQGKFWLYPYLWPVDIAGGFINRLEESMLDRILLRSKFIHQIKIDEVSFSAFDDTRNPTLSYKDRASILVAVKAFQMGIREISAASTGNAGSSIAGICAALGLKAHVFVPKNIPASKRIQIQTYGADIYVVDGDYDSAFDLCYEVSNKKNWYNRNTALNPMTIEGKKSAAFDLFIETQGILPDNIIVPVGDGVIISGLHKGFRELYQLGWIDKIPKLIAAQAEGSNALIRFLNTEKFEYEPASTIADSISAGAPRNLFLAADAVKESGGFALAVSDDEILRAQKIIARASGFLIEPSSAVTFAVLKKIIKEKLFIPDEKYLLMFTGNGLKDISSLSKWNAELIPKKYDEWKEYFKL